MINRNLHENFLPCGCIIVIVPDNQNCNLIVWTTFWHIVSSLGKGTLHKLICTVTTNCSIGAVNIRVKLIINHNPQGPLHHIPCDNSAIGYIKCAVFRINQRRINIKVVYEIVDLIEVRKVLRDITFILSLPEFRETIVIVSRICIHRPFAIDTSILININTPCGIICVVEQSINGKKRVITGIRQTSELDPDENLITEWNKSSLNGAYVDTFFKTRICWVWCWIIGWFCR
mmetsp:Transcript_3383/g.4894  ORF Transcript_3383/g.4894 Transcript_3383/m.4894 type:complete len:231 (-) Transcript_3383:429-1121(-)